MPEILNDMPNLKPPLAVLLELLPRLAPRYYSLSSAPSVHGTRLHVTAIVVRQTTPTGRVLDGALFWISALKKSVVQQASARRGLLAWPANPSSRWPVLCARATLSCPRRSMPRC